MNKNALLLGAILLLSSFSCEKKEAVDPETLSLSKVAVSGGTFPNADLYINVTQISRRADKEKRLSDEDIQYLVSNLNKHKDYCGSVDTKILFALNAVMQFSSKQKKIVYDACVNTLSSQCAQDNYSFRESLVAKVFGKLKSKEAIPHLQKLSLRDEDAKRIVNEQIAILKE